MKSTYLQLHTKKRIRLAQSRLNDLVFVKSNRALKRRREENTSRDPILLKEIDESNEWLLGRMEGDSDEDDLVFEDDTLTWGVLPKLMGQMSLAIELELGNQRALQPLRLRQRTKEKPLPPLLNLPEFELN